MDDRLEKEAALCSLSRLSNEILKACQDVDEMLDALEDLKVINKEEKNDANKKDDYTGVIEKFRQKIDSDPSFFTDFCCHITGVQELSDIAVRLVEIYSEYTVNGQSSPTSITEPIPSPDPTRDNKDDVISVSDSGVPDPSGDPLAKLKERLIVINGLPCDSDDGRQDILRMTRRAISSFITTSLDAGVEVASVYTDMQNVLTKRADIVVDGSVCRWSVKELENEYKERNPDSSPLQDIIHSLDASSDEEEEPTPPAEEFKPFDVNEVNFSKMVVQNSIFACHLLEKSDAATHMEHMAHTNFLFEVNKSEPLILERKKIDVSKRDDENISLEPFTVVSVVPVDDNTSEPSTSTTEIVAPPIQTPPTEISHPVHRYLIGRGAAEPNGHVVYYVAFSSHQSLREWKDGHTSFKDGLEKQQEQLPIQFIMEKIWGGASVVLTGFSFGGSLAQLCGITLYSQSQGVCSDLLEKNLLCVTFGQPVISLPKTNSSADNIINKSRFHAIYMADDKVPRLLSHLDPTCTGYADSDMPENFKSQVSKDEIYQNVFSTFIIKQLIVLQEKYDDCRADVACADVKKSSQKGVDDSTRHETSQKVTKRGCEGESGSLQAKRDLRALLKKSKRQIRSSASSYITYKVLDGGEFVDRELEFHADTDIKEDMFMKHNTTKYLNEITLGYTDKEPKVKVEQADALISSDFVKPSIKRVEIHHFSHHERTALSLEGENLCFTVKFKLHLHKSDKEHLLTVAQKESVSSRSIQLQEVPISMPTELSSSTDSNLVNSDYKESEERATICLFTHFGEVSCDNVEVKHKKFYISCRRRQVANLSVAEVIELSFLGALLEQQPAKSQSQSHSPSKRYSLIERFLEEIVNIVPIESAFSCIANMADDEKGQRARHLCHVLKTADVKPPLSLSFFMNTALAISRLRGDVVDSTDAVSLEDLFFVFFVVAKRRASPWLWWKQESEGKYLKWFRSDIGAHSRNSDMVKYLQASVEEAIKSSMGRIYAVSGDSIKSLFDATKKLSTSERIPGHTTLLSPRCLLLDRQKKLHELQQEARRQATSNPQSFARTGNAMLLDFVKKLRNEDLNICIQTITAFIKEEVRVPITEFHLDISYWQLLIKFGLGIFRRKVSNDYTTEYVSVGKHIKSIATCAAANSEYADKLQFLLRSSLHQDEELPLFDDKFLMYSLEDHLYSRFTDTSLSKNQRVDESTSLDDIVGKWDTLFKDVAMGSVLQSHRRLVASWLKFSLMVHKLRTELSCHTTLGIVGLVNSGKSTLVKDLFNIKAVETGTLADKRTTVPFLYSIQGVDNFDVIDFPGVDDQDDHISDLVNLLRTLSQLVVFVVNYRNAHTRAAVEWYRKLNQYAIPHLVCLTHGDRLYAECVNEREGKANRSADKIATPTHPNYREIIAKEVETICNKIKSEASGSPLRCLGLFSLKVDNDSKLKTPEGQQNIVDAGIEGLKDVGRWIVTALEEDLKEQATAQLLKTHFKLS